MNNQTDEHKLLAKLEKLLALAGGTDEHEANSAMEKAMQLAVENNIELSRLNINDRKNEEMQKEEVDLKVSRMPITQKWVSNIIKTFFQVKVLNTGGRNVGRSLIFVGKREHIDFAKFLNTYLTNTFFNLWYAYYKKNPHETVATARESYFYGLFAGLTKKLQDAKDEAERAISAAFKDGYALMLTDDKKALDEALVTFFPVIKTTKGKATTIRSNNAMNEGYENGQNINVHAGLNEGNKNDCLVDN